MDSVCVIGLGYVGLPTAAMFATHGKQVHGVDTNPQIIDTLQAGGIHIEEPGLAAFVQAALVSERLRVRMEPVLADAFILAVPTPFTTGHRPDLRYVLSAVRAIVPYLRPGNVVILESTSPPGTTLSLVPILEESGLRVGTDILLAYSPERVLPGRILTELVVNDRVVGGHTVEAARAGADLFRAFVTGEIMLTDATTAEMVKLMENTYRDVNIALANEFSHIAAHVGINANEAIRLANYHPRVKILQPGPGVGGHCIAVDPWFLVAAAPQSTQLIRTARAVNDAQPEYVVGLVRRAVADIASPVIAILGLAYKAGVDDLRGSPALDVVKMLTDIGYQVRVHDDHAHRLPDGTPIERDLVTILTDADLLVVLTDHDLYRRMKPNDCGPAAMSHRRLLDTRDCIEANIWEAAGFTVDKLGSGQTHSTPAVSR